MMDFVEWFPVHFRGWSTGWLVGKQGKQLNCHQDRDHNKPRDTRQSVSQWAVYSSQEKV